eukprot:1149540-Pelagomonas_calceolata.AAC.2
MGPLMVQSKLFKLVQGMISIAGPTNTHKDSVESHNFSTNDARAAGLHEVGGAVSRVWLVWSSVLGCVCCVAHGVSGWKKEKKEWVWVDRELCCANLPSLPMSILTKPAPKGLLLRALMIILPATWRSPGRGHNGLVDLLKRTAHPSCGGQIYHKYYFLHIHLVKTPDPRISLRPPSSSTATSVVIFKGLSSSHPPYHFVRCGGVIYTPHTLGPLKELGPETS